MATPITLLSFVGRWQGSTLSERSAAQSHFIELCQVLGQPTPAVADQAGTFYTFEKGVAKAGGGRGFADVWLRGHFAWEYKGRHRDLAAAYQQLLQYKDDLENPPLLITCDLDAFEVHTNYPNTPKTIHLFTVADLLRPDPLPAAGLSALEVLRAAFTDPERLRPQQTTAQVTEAAAGEFARLAESLCARGHDPEGAAHFLMRLLFCLFSEDIGLLPSGLFTRLVEATRARPAEFARRLGQLVAAMAGGGSFGVDDIAHFDGGLFADGAVLELTRADLDVLARATRLDWASVEPAIFGTLLERSLNPSKRAQIGAHFTSKEDILLIVEPVLMAPLRREWAGVRQQAQVAAAKRDRATGAGRARHQQTLLKLLMGFATRLAAHRVLDPACGSGNFLYVALKELLDLEKEVITFAATTTGQSFFPQVEPRQLHGIEVNPYAFELAQVVVWIGYIQWLHDNGFGVPSQPILKPLDTIRHEDAVLGRDDGGQLAEPPWPEADTIVGNPPFLGGKMLRRNLGDEYVDALFALYDGRVPREADLVCYWFERARALVADGKVKRVGLLATQGIRGGANRRVLERIKTTGDIFLAWQDRPWVLDGAAVHVSMVGFDNGAEKERTQDGSPAEAINADLTRSLDLTQARRLGENLELVFMGDTKGGAFDVPPDVAAKMLAAPLNPNGRYNADVLRPWVNGLDVARRPRGLLIVDFGVAMSEREASLYEAPFEHVVRHVRPARGASRTTRSEWWLHERPRPEMRAALAPLRRFVVTLTVSKHRLFVWVEQPTLPDHQLIAIARSDDYFFGALHSKPHELWARRRGTQLREAESGFRYTPTTTFETFPFPWPPGQEPAGDPRVEAIARAARELVRLRDAWLNPPGASPDDLKTRTLTSLYNKPPTWLQSAHATLDRAVLDAYGWSYNLTDDGILARLLALNHVRAGVPAAEAGDV